LELPDDIEFVEVDSDGFIGQQPGISRGMYMWVSDSYIIEPEGEINLILRLRGVRPGESLIRFRVTTNKIYVDCDDIEIEVES